MPTLKAGKTELNETRIVDFLKRHAIGHCFMEKVAAMPGQGVVSMFRFGESFGILKGLLFGLGIGCTLVLPQRWKKWGLDGMAKGKGASIVRVKQLYPKLELSRKKDHNRADAVLIALYGLKNLNGNRL